LPGGIVIIVLKVEQVFLHVNIIMEMVILEIVHIVPSIVQLANKEVTVFVLLAQLINTKFLQIIQLA